MTGKQRQIVLNPGASPLDDWRAALMLLDATMRGRVRGAVRDYGK